MPTREAADEIFRALMDSQVNDDLDLILTQKTSGEAAVKVKDAEGDGWIAMYKVHQWNVTLTQSLLQYELR